LNAIGDQATARKLVTILEEHGHLIRITESAVVIAGKRRREAWRIVRARARARHGVLLREPKNAVGI